VDAFRQKLRFQEACVCSRFVLRLSWCVVSNVWMIFVLPADEDAKKPAVRLAIPTWPSAYVRPKERKPIQHGDPYKRLQLSEEIRVCYGGTPKERWQLPAPLEMRTVAKARKFAEEFDAATAKRKREDEEDPSRRQSKTRKLSKDSDAASAAASNAADL
jgi:hypothetical protein